VLPTPVAESPLALLEGTWQGPGNGSYPTIESFTYDESVTFAPLPGKPVLAYTQRTTSAMGLPLHTETGYLRCTDAERVEFVVAQPTGITETHVGTARREPSGALVIDLHSTSVGLTPGAKEVRAVTRRLRVDGDELTYEVGMAAVGQTDTVHLTATLRRITD
jgi:hypothetical protein